MSDTSTRRRTFTITIDVAVWPGEDADEICNAAIAHDLEERRLVDAGWTCTRTHRPRPSDGGQVPLCDDSSDGKYACEFPLGHEGMHGTDAGKRW